MIDGIPSSCCGKFDKNERSTSQVGGCTLEEVKSKRGCGLLFNELFSRAPKVLTNIQTFLVCTFYVTAVLAIILSLMFIKQIGNGSSRLNLAFSHQKNIQS